MKIVMCGLAVAVLLILGVTGVRADEAVFFGSEGQQAAACAQTLAAFLSLPGYKLANVQPVFSGVLYTIAGPSRNQH